MDQSNKIRLKTRNSVIISMIKSNFCNEFVYYCNRYQVNLPFYHNFLVFGDPLGQLPFLFGLVMAPSGHSQADPNRAGFGGIAEIPCPNFRGRERANKGLSNRREYRLTGGEIEGLLADSQEQLT